MSRSQRLDSCTRGSGEGCHSLSHAIGIPVGSPALGGLQLSAMIGLHLLERRIKTDRLQASHTSEGALGMPGIFLLLIFTQLHALPLPSLRLSVHHVV